MPSSKDLVALIVATCSLKFNVTRPDGRHLEAPGVHVDGTKTTLRCGCVIAYLTYPQPIRHRPGPRGSAFAGEARPTAHKARAGASSWPKVITMSLPLA